MSDNLMDTSPGGEGSQYEHIQTVTNPTDKSGGQQGEPETSSIPSQSTTANMASSSGSGDDNSSGGDEKYETKVERGGAGGLTANSEESAGAGESYGAVPDEEGDAEGGGRSQQGYGGNNDMDTTIGG